MKATVSDPLAPIYCRDHKSSRFDHCNRDCKPFDWRQILFLGTDIQRSMFDSSKVDDDRTTPPQFFLPGSLTPADVTKWGSGCWKHCWEGFSGRCKLCGSTACR